jgi:peptidoglycan hydrolase-like protein with peptidoglycan-binding domain
MKSMILKRGARGDEVRELQERLNRLGFQLAVDGELGDQTERAVCELQTLFGHTADGLVNERTQRLIDSEIERGWNLQLPNAQELALRAQGGGGAGTGRLHDAQHIVHEMPRTPTVPDAAHTAVPTGGASIGAPRARRPSGRPPRR